MHAFRYISYDANNSTLLWQCTSHYNILHSCLLAQDILWYYGRGGSVLCSDLETTNLYQAYNRLTDTTALLSLNRT